MQSASQNIITSYGANITLKAEKFLQILQTLFMYKTVLTTFSTSNVSEIELIKVWLELCKFLGEILGLLSLILVANFGTCTFASL